jgi:hypothetical protein
VVAIGSIVKLRPAEKVLTGTSEFGYCVSWVAAVQHLREQAVLINGCQF